MTLWLDAHLDPQLAAWIGVTFHVSAKHLSETGLLDADDLTIFKAASRLPEIVLMTKDADFIDLLNHHGPPPAVVRLAFGNASTLDTQMRLRDTLGPALEAIRQGEPLVEID